MPLKKDHSHSEMAEHAGQKSRPAYLEVEIPLQGLDPDLLSGLLYVSGTLGIQELAPDRWLAYFPADCPPDSLHRLLARIRQLHPHFDAARVRIQTLPYQNWAEAWKQNFRPFQPVEGVWVRPPWESLPAGAQGIDLIIEPRMAFGTGHHESTRLVMAYLVKAPPRGRDVLDVGTGSGILAILAERLGARRVIGIDIDPEAVASARHNARLNQTSGIEFFQAEISTQPDERFDLVLANLHLSLHLSQALEYLRVLRPGGLVVLSGILKSDLPQIGYVYRQSGLLEGGQMELNGWVASLWERGP